VLASRAEDSAMPHSPQNLNSGGFSNPQRGHGVRIAVPQLPQNFIPGGFSVLQLEHRIESSLSRRLIESRGDPRN
jgi:hypothetical protein